MANNEFDSGEFIIQGKECKKNDPLDFADYHWGDLRDSEQHELEHHTFFEGCGWCLEQLNKTERILKGNDQPTREEREDHLRFYVSPIAQRLKDEAKKEAIEELEPRLMDLEVDVRQLKNQAYDQEKPAIKQLLPDKDNKVLKSQPPQKTSKIKAGDLVVAGLMLVAVFIAGLIVYDKASKPKLKPLPEIEEALKRDRAPIKNSYEKLDTAIENYLLARSIKDTPEAVKQLDAVKLLAGQMQKSGDDHGILALKYYEAIQDGQLKNLIDGRSLRRQIEAMSPHDNFQTARQKAFQAKTIFSIASAQYEEFMIDFHLAKYLNRAGQYAEALKIIEEDGNRVRVGSYPFFTAQFLYLRGQNLSSVSRTAEGLSALVQAEKLVVALDVPLFKSRINIAIGNIYHATNEDALAFEQAESAIKNSLAAGYEVPIQALHILGISAFNMGSPGLAESYLRRSVNLSETRDKAYLPMSRAWFGLVLAEQGQIETAEEQFKEALLALGNITNEQARHVLELRVIGYYGRAEKLAGKPAVAVNLYQRAISLAVETNLQQKLMLAQLNQGMGESLKAVGRSAEGDSALAVAKELYRQAKETAETGNQFASFATGD